MGNVMKYYLVTGLLAFIAMTIQAADAPPPPASLSDQEGQEEIEPEVVIIQRDDKTIEEYRVNGQLYMIKVTPKHAPPYYLLDKDGDGTMETKTATDLEPDIQIPRWVLFRW
jgi:uncharacterized protein DUF2782